MTLKTERRGCRFAVAKTDGGKPVIQLGVSRHRVEAEIVTVGL